VLPTGEGGEEVRAVNAWLRRGAGESVIDYLFRRKSRPGIPKKEKRGGGEHLSTTLARSNGRDRFIRGRERRTHESALGPGTSIKGLKRSRHGEPG